MPSGASAPPGPRDSTREMNTAVRQEHRQPPPRQVDPRTLKRWLDAGRAVLIDVREPDEYAREHIPGARLVPLSRFDPAELPREPGRAVVLQCRSGNRSREAAELAAARGGAPGEEVYDLKGGILGWERAGLPVERRPGAPLPIMRQVQIAAGSLVLLGLLLAWLASPWFALLSALVGAGLVFAGVTGTCGMASLLGRLPYNRRAAAP